MRITDSNGFKYPINPVVVTTLLTTNLAHFKQVTYRVKIVKYITTNTVSQCKNCQRKPICGRCSGNHQIAEFNRQKSTIECSGFGGDHVACYRQCPAREQFLAMRETPRHNVQTRTDKPPRHFHDPWFRETYFLGKSQL